jgi:hypothetical protein
MPYAVTIAVVAIVLVLVALVVPRARAARPRSTTLPARDESVPVMPPKDTRPLTRAELAGKLKRLEEAPVPPPQPMAMCYEAAAPPSTVDYVCPRDHSRTQVSTDSGLAERIRQLTALRMAVRTVSGLSLLLDESEFCHQCTPEPPPSPEPILVVKLPDGAEKRTRGVAPDDLLLLREFVDGALRHRGDDGEEIPLSKFLPRIRELLGVPGAEVGPKPR